jgi:hypothetical protein
MLWQHCGVRDWPGRDHVETLRAWPALAETVSRIESLPELFCGVMLLGSLSRGEGDSISDIDWQPLPVPISGRRRGILGSSFRPARLPRPTAPREGRGLLGTTGSLRTS